MVYPTVVRGGPVYREGVSLRHSGRAGRGEGHDRPGRVGGQDHGKRIRVPETRVAGRVPGHDLHRVVGPLRQVGGDGPGVRTAVAQAEGSSTQGAVARPAVGPGIDRGAGRGVEVQPDVVDNAIVAGTPTDGQAAARL